MDETASTVMLVGGGEGMGKLEATAEALAQTCVTSHIFLSPFPALTHTHIMTIIFSVFVELSRQALAR